MSQVKNSFRTNFYRKDFLLTSAGAFILITLANWLMDDRSASSVSLWPLVENAAIAIIVGFIAGFTIRKI